MLWTRENRPVIIIQKKHLLAFVVYAPDSVCASSGKHELFGWEVLESPPKLIHASLSRNTEFEPNPRDSSYALNFAILKTQYPVKARPLSTASFILSFRWLSPFRVKFSRTCMCSAKALKNHSQALDSKNQNPVQNLQEILCACICFSLIWKACVQALKTLHSSVTWISCLQMNSGKITQTFYKNTLVYPALRDFDMASYRFEKSLGEI